jgi:streptogramin lyase
MNKWFSRPWFSSARQKCPRPRRIFLSIEQLEDRLVLAPMTFTVTDASDASTNSLRVAITASNANNPGAGMFNTINFAITGAGVQTISLLSALPTISQAVEINGYSENNGTTQATANTLANADNAAILIQIDGTSAGTNVNGLTLGTGSGGSTIEGLDVTNFQGDGNLNNGVGILVQSDGNTIVGNFVGVDPTGTTQAANQGDGIRIVGASNNIIGTTNPADRNVSSGNALDGIHVEGSLTAPATGNTIEGNFVGVAADGKSALIPAANGSQPYGITQGADGNLWFTEIANNAIARITPAGVVTTFSLAGLQAGSRPEDIVSDPNNGLLYFTEFGTGQIGAINPMAGSDAAILASETESAVVPSGAGAEPNGITLGPDGNLWFAEGSADRIGNINPTLTTINEFATGIGALPVNIVSGADGDLWFTEKNKNAIGRITTVGIVTEFSLAALGANNGPFDIVSDPNNSLLYFTEANVGQIGRINPLAGTDTLILASETQSAVVPSGAGANPGGITVGPDGNLWFTEFGVSRIGNINPNLTTINEFSAGVTPGAGPDHIVTGPDGALWFTEFNGGRIGRITTAGSASEFTTMSGGTGARGNNFFGIEISGGNANTIGGGTAGARNVVGLNDAGIALDNGAQGNVIQGNYSGVGADGVTQDGNLLQGIVLFSSGNLAAPFGPGQTNEPGVQNNVIGGTAAGEGNLVEFNGTAGIAVFGNPVSLSGQPNTGNAIEGNLLFENGRSNPTGEIGIDLSNQFVFPKDDGVTPNDSQGHGAANDPNNFQNFPGLTSATQVSGGFQIAGTLTQSVSPNTTYRIEFYVNNPDPLGGVAEGQTFIGFANVTTNASGTVSFAPTFNVSLSPGQVVTADATDPTGNTSEFSAGLVVTPPPTVQFSTASQNVNETAGTFTVTVTLSAVSSANTTVPFTLSGTAVAGTDYSGVTASPLVISAGQTTGMITGTLLPDPGASKTIIFTLGAPTDATLGSPAADTLTITEPPLIVTAIITSLFTTTGLTAGAASAFENTPFTLAINGSNFAAGATVTFGATTLTPDTITPTQVTVTVPGSVSLAYDGEVINIAVVNPGQVPSNVLRFSVLTANQRFLYDVYSDLLHRTIDASGLASWGAMLDAGVSRFNVVLGIENDPGQEFLHVEVNDAFMQYLGRNADASGLISFTNLLAGGGTVEQMDALIASSPEYLTYHTDGTYQGFLTAFYQDALNRTPISTDPGVSSPLAPYQVATDVFASPEFERDLAASFYLQYLDRPFGTGDDVRAGTPDGMQIAEITGDPGGEYYNKTAP